jgi:hypothetical protein
MIYFRIQFNDWINGVFAMSWSPKNRFTLKLFAAIVAMVFLAASLISPDWIERTTGFEPDNDSGRLEWGLSLAAVAVFVVASWLARRQWRALR